MMRDVGDMWQVLKLLLEYNAKTDATDQEERKPLHIAAQWVILVIDWLIISLGCDLFLEPLIRE